MNEVELLRTLGSSARQEREPAVDVAGRVLREIESREPQSSALWSGLAALSSSAAVIVGILAWQAWVECFDPFNRLFGSFVMGMQ